MLMMRALILVKFYVEFHRALFLHPCYIFLNIYDILNNSQFMHTILFDDDHN